LLQQRQRATSNNFLASRVTTSDRLLVQNGKMVAIGFKCPADKRPVDLNKNKSSEVTSSAL